MGYVIKASVAAPFDRHVASTRVTDTKNGDLAAINGMVEEGWIKPHVDRTFPLEETAQAIDYMNQGNVRGKVVITL